VVIVMTAAQPSWSEESRTTDVRVPRKEGAPLEATLHRPVKGNAVGVVLAPGAGDHRGPPLMVRCAERLAEAGFTVLRFDWAYFTRKEEPSSDLAAEVRDLDAAIAHVRSLPGVERVAVAGKSLGSMVALQRVAARPDDVVGLGLLTFPLPDEQQEVRSGIVQHLGAFDVPTVIITGDQDPLAPLEPLYALVARAERPPRLVIVPGDHGFSKSRQDPSETPANVDFAAHALTLWFTRFAGL
jgi:predicted alpha/beta-hydrolase family hydrolase